VKHTTLLQDKKKKHRRNKHMKQTAITHATLYHYGPWQIATHVTHALCSDGIRRYARLTTQEPDTFFSHPATVQVKGRSVSGFIMSFTNEDGKEDYGFIAYTYRKNGSLLPGNSHVR
jgi:hypothetical protein